ncbi:PaaI family thioesterase [Nocardiopsis exhalans]|uniref:Medium/long-chain acyl-CoA thioesterase YigI n=1 Tax=Nocardiopsis exhalans TaxID=163604 RepID=A0ABY5D8T8_9ACTN|nr:PaaI family thioesterase [Nocardiopsis exhalans]USY19795.1 PaaI family thioesterase [Nocardiopsis exhalans]
MAQEITPELANLVLDAQPFSKLVEARVTVFEPRRAVLEVDVRDDLLQQNGFLHGGVLSYAADNALTFAGGSVLGASVLTSGFSIEYLRPGKGVLLNARAHVLESTRRRAVCRCDLVMIDSEGAERLVAAAQGTITLVE